MAQSVKLRRRLSSNRYPLEDCCMVKLPKRNSRISVLTVRNPCKKTLRCSNCNVKLRGIVSARSFEKFRISVILLCHRCLRNKIVRVFLTEEQNIIVAVLNAQKSEEN